MSEHPISDLLTISMNNIKDMIDVDTIIGEAISIADNIKVIPVSKVKTTFVAGGTDQFKAGSLRNDEMSYPFGGATGGTVTIVPIAFICVNKGEVKILHLDDQTSIYERLIDQVPELVNTIKDMISSKNEKSDDTKCGE